MSVIKQLFKAQKKSERIAQQSTTYVFPSFLFLEVLIGGLGWFVAHDDDDAAATAASVYGSYFGRSHFLKKKNSSNIDFIVEWQRGDWVYWCTQSSLLTQYYISY